MEHHLPPHCPPPLHGVQETLHLFTGRWPHLAALGEVHSAGRRGPSSLETCLRRLGSEVTSFWCVRLGRVGGRGALLEIGIRAGVGCCCAPGCCEWWEDGMGRRGWDGIGRVVKPVYFLMVAMSLPCYLSPRGVRILFVQR